MTTGRIIANPRRDLGPRFGTREPMVTWLRRWSPERRFGGSIPSQHLGGLTC